MFAQDMLTVFCVLCGVTSADFLFGNGSGGVGSGVASVEMFINTGGANVSLPAAASHASQHIQTQNTRGEFVMCMTRSCMFRHTFPIICMNASRAMCDAPNMREDVHRHLYESHVVELRCAEPERVHARR